MVPIQEDWEGKAKTMRDVRQDKVERSPQTLLEKKLNILYKCLFWKGAYKT